MHHSTRTKPVAGKTEIPPAPSQEILREQRTKVAGPSCPGTERRLLAANGIVPSVRRHPAGGQARRDVRRSADPDRPAAGERRRAATAVGLTGWPTPEADEGKPVAITISTTRRSTTSAGSRTAPRSTPST